MEEARVGYRAIAELRELVEDYAIAHTVSGKGYIGEKWILGMHHQLYEYLRN